MKFLSSIMACCLFFSTTSAFTTTQTTQSSTQLWMNKKKARSGGGGFGGASPKQDKFPYTGSVRPGVQSPQRVVLEESIVKPDYATSGRPSAAKPMLPWLIEVKSAEEVEKMRKAGRLAREILDLAGRAALPGVTTDEIDTLVHKAVTAVSAGWIELYIGKCEELRI